MYISSHYMWDFYIYTIITTLTTVRKMISDTHTKKQKKNEDAK